MNRSSKEDFSAALLLANRRRKEAQRLSGVGFWELDLKAERLYWSEEIYAIYEIDENIEPNYEIFLQLTHEDDRDTVNQAYRDSVASGEEYNIRYRVKAGDAFKWIEARGVTLYDTDGVPERSIGTAQDISEIMSAQQKIEHLAHHDALTNLPNRRLFSDRINAAIRLADRQGSNLAVLFLDLDNFKQVNDRCGHEVGDDVLRGVADRLRCGARASDTFARFGGDEFAGILVDVDPNRLSEAVAHIKSVIDGGYETRAGLFDITASIGVTIYPLDRGTSDILLRHADLAMYEAKEQGKSRICFFDTVKQRSNQTRLALLADIEEAIRTSSLELYFQPRVNLMDGVPAGAEALMRWFRPDGPVAPSDIVKTIRGTPVEWLLDTWVISAFLRHVSSFHELGVSGPFSVNVCPGTVEHSDFPAHFSALLGASGVSGEDIEIEILETSSISNFAQTDSTLRACKELGVSFSLDDFGTGFSSLTHFHTLAIDKLKIDQDFIRSLSSDAESLPLVKSILAIARNNNRPVVAEGVETESAARLLAELGCEYAQGYGIARPMAVSDYITWTRAWDAGSFLNVDAGADSSP